MKPLVKIYLKLILLGAVTSCFGQSLPLTHYGTNEGLPSSETYSIYQDSKFRYWICTDNGISLFNGSTFTNYSIKDGLPTNTIFSSFENKNDGKMWFITYGFGLCYFDELKNRFICPKFNDELIRIFNKKFINTCQFDVNGNLWVTYSLIELLKVDSLGRITKYKNIQKREMVGFEIIKEPGINIVKGRYDTISKSKTPLSKITSLNKITIFCVSNLNSSVPLLLNIDKNEFVFSYFNKLYFIIPNQQVFSKSFESNIMSLMKDKSNRIWVGTEKDGLQMFYYDNLNKNNSQINSEQVSSIIQDKYGKIWYTTLTNGIFCNVNQNISNNFHGNIVRKIFVEDRSKLILTSIGKGYQFKRNETKFQIIDFKKEVKDIKRGNKNKLFICKSIYLRDIPTKLEITDIPFSAIEFIDKKIYVGGKNSLVVYKTNNSYESIKTVPSPILKFSKIDNTSLLVGCLNGLYIFSNDKFYQVQGPKWLPKTRINDIENYKSKIFILTDGKGLLSYNSLRVNPLNQVNGIAINSANCLEFQNDSIAWIGSSDGLYKVKFITDSKYKLIYKFTINDGLPSNEINDIKIIEGKLHVGTNNGLSIFNSDISPTDKISPLFIDLVLGNFKDTLFMGYSRNINIYVENQWRNLFIKFSTNKDKTNHIHGLMSYRLLKDNSVINDWTFIADNSLQFTNLVNGHYKFEIKIHDPILNEEYHTSASFYIKPYFYEILWVKLLFLLLVLVFILYLVKLVFKKIEFDNELKRKMISAEIDSLRNQMNPHFIFNALNSIQHFIIENNPLKASKFLVKFSTLIRKSLEFSKLNFISLYDELLFIEEYIEIEQVRFNYKFNFVIEVDHNINTKLAFIPPLLMQPLVENSIKHGFSEKKDNGMIWINLKKTSNDRISYSVKDNGTGISPNLENDSDYKTSLSHEILKERFHLLGETYGDKELIGMEVKNLIFENKFGTEIILKLPIKHD